MNNNNNKFAIRLRSLRKECGMTQDDLAKELHLTKQAISQYERGVREPQFELLEMISDYFNIDSDYLIGREDRSTLLLNSIELEVITKFRSLSLGERSMFLRSLGIDQRKDSNDAE